MPDTLGSGTFGSGTFGDPLGGAPPPPSTAGGTTPKPQIIAEVAWGSYPLGEFVLDVSAIGGSDTLGVSPYDTTFGGPYDQLKLKSFRITQGKSAKLAQMEAGGATLDVRDPDGLLNPENPLSPLATQLDDRLHPVRVTGIYNVAYPLFYGWVRSVQWEPSGRRGISQLECVDLFYLLDRVKPIIAATGPTTTGAAIGKILDFIQWIDPNLRSLSIGDLIPNFVADGKKTGLQLIADLLEAERGLFFHRGDAVAVYESRLVRAARTSIDAVVDTMTMARPGLDVDRIVTKATVTRTGGLPQVFENTPATTKWQTSEGDEIETPYLNNDTDAMGLAEYIVSSKKDPRSNVRDVEITNADPDLLVTMLARQPGERVSLSEARGGMAGDFHIERRELTGDGTSYKASWVVSRASEGVPFTLDTSTLDGTDVLVF
jgi:hypothetical protein